MREKQYPQPSTALTGPRPDPGLQGLLQAWAGKHAATAPRRLGSLQNSYKILIIGDAAPTARRIGLLASASCARLVSSHAAAVDAARACDETEADQNMSLVHDRVISAERRGVLVELEKRRFAPIHEELELREGDAPLARLA